MQKMILMFIMLIGLSGCASTAGNNFDSSNILKLSQGSSYSEATMLLGEPHQIINGADGNVTAQWLFVRTDLSMTPETKNVVILFDKSQKLVRFVTLQGINLSPAEQQRLMK